MSPERFVKGESERTLLMQLALLASHSQFDAQNAVFWTQLDAISRFYFQLDAGIDAGP